MASPRRNVLLVEPWFAGSHKAWAEGLRRASRHSIELLTRPPAGWKATFEQSAQDLAGRAGPPPELVIVSGMMDAADFRELAGFDDVPTLLYLHENQLTYDRRRPDLVRGAVNWRSVHDADRIAFNSQFHLTDFFAAVPALGVAEMDRAEARARSLVLPVGIDPPTEPRRIEGPPAVLWNHRWEADNHPQTKPII